MKKFNTAAVCIPSKHYMVDITDRVKEIKKLVDDGEYFTINRARQYGKTTTLNALCSLLHSEYLVISLDFQDIGDAVFKTEGSFARGMSRILCDAAEFLGVPIPDGYIKEFEKIKQILKNIFIHNSPLKGFIGNIFNSNTSPSSADNIQ